MPVFRKLGSDSRKEEAGYLEIGGELEILNEIRCNAAFVAVGLVVEIQGLGLRIQLGRVGDERLDGLDMRERFHPELAVEATPEGLEYLVLLLRPVPHIPLVHVADGRVGCDLPVAPGTTGVVGCMRGFLGDGIGEEFFVDVPCWEVRLEPR